MHVENMDSYYDPDVLNALLLQFMDDKLLVWDFKCILGVTVIGMAQGVALQSS